MSSLCRYIAEMVEDIRWGIAQEVRELAEEFRETFKRKEEL